MCIRKGRISGKCGLGFSAVASGFVPASYSLEKSNGQDLLPVVHRHVYRIQCSANPIEPGVIGVMHVKRSLCTMIQQVISRGGG